MNTDEERSKVHSSYPCSSVFICGRFSSEIERAERFGAIPAADVDRVDMAHLRFAREMRMPAEGVADVRKFQQQLAELLGAEIGLGEIPLRAVRRREKLAKRKVMCRRDDRFDVYE